MKNIETIVSKNSWDEWGKHVLNELTRLGDAMEDTRKDISDINTKLAVTQTELKIKASVFGAIGGAIPLITGLIIFIIKSII